MTDVNKVDDVHAIRDLRNGVNTTVTVHDTRTMRDTTHGIHWHYFTIHAQYILERTRRP